MLKVEEISPQNMFSIMNENSKVAHRRWGQYQVIKQGQRNGLKIKVKLLKIQKNCNISYQYHQYRNEKWLCLKGNGDMVIDGVETKIFPGEVIIISKNQNHSIRAVEEVSILEIQYGEKTLERDIVRITKDWNQIPKK